MTFDAGFLVLFLVDEILPGDSMRYEATAYVRMATPLFPMFDNQRVDTFFFFVPNRLVWIFWRQFMGQQRNPADTIAYSIPQVISPINGFAAHSIYDHMGLPTVGQTSAGQAITVNSLPFRAYNAIWNEWFRDENSQDSVASPDNIGPDAVASFNLLRRNKSHDYFTSALPWPQKFTAPNIPLSGTAPVIGIGTDNNAFTGGPLAVWETNAGATTNYNWYDQVNITVRGSAAIGTPQIFANLSAATATFTVNVLREAFLVQQLLERDARGGTRYIEIIKNHFKVNSPDARQQRPEYIGGGSTPLNLTPIAQTAPVAGVGLGALGAAGTSVGRHTASYAATEHGYVIGLINVRSELSYQQGVHRMWTRNTRYDFYWPALAGLGEQAILRRELYSLGTAADLTVFGYQERWHEYRTRYSEITGQFRSYYAGTLDAWHLGQRLTVPPVLGPSFLEENPPMIRVLAAGGAANNQQYLADILISRDATRPIPSFGTPVMLGRF